jgi:hypothetical protein
MANLGPETGQHTQPNYPDGGDYQSEGEYRGVGERRYSGSSPARYGPPPGRRGIFIDTEARRGFTTTEFWLTIVGVAALVIMAYNSDLLGVRYGMGMATAVLLGYILSRGIAKAGSDEVVRRDRDDF